MLVGTSTADDAAVYRVSDELAIIQTVDFFTPIVDDPFAFGAIAAANSLSDVYAMGGRPVMALNVVGFPSNNEEVPLSVLGEIMKGGAAKALEAGIYILGGHTVDDKEPKYGLSVTGFVHPDRIWRNVGGKPGDKLILTKPIGTGIISTAVRKGKASEWVEHSVRDWMATLNRAAGEAAQEVGVNACTDITGFGLLGHLREMLGDGTVGARIAVAAVPVIEGTRELMDEGFVPGGTRRNLRSLEGHIRFDEAVAERDQLLLADAQTSGGLLFAVASEKAEELQSGLRCAGVASAPIGELVAEHTGKIHVTS